MKNLVITLISATAGLVTGMVIKDLIDKDIDNTRLLIDKLIDERHDVFDKIDDLDQKNAYENKCFELVKEAYHSNNKEEILENIEKIKELFDGIELVCGCCDDIIDDEQEEMLYQNIVERTLQGITPESTEPQPEFFDNGNDCKSEESQDIIHPVKITVDESDRYREEDENGESDITSDIEAISEGEFQNKQEEDMEPELSSEEQPVVQSSLDVQVEEVAAAEEPSRYESEYNKLIMYFINPLVDRYGQEYEEQLVDMAEKLARPSTSPDIYYRFTNKLKGLVNSHKSIERGVRNIKTILNEFSEAYNIG